MSYENESRRHSNTGSRSFTTLALTLTRTRRKSISIQLQNSGKLRRKPFVYLVFDSARNILSDLLDSH